MELAHVVVSMVSSRPAKVICKTCRSQHNYKRGTAATVAPLSPRAPRERKTIARVAEVWEQKIAENKSPVRPYSVQSLFAQGDVLQHPSFGLGIVEEVRSNGKITVLFRQDQKVLIHGMAKPQFSAS